MPWATPTLRTVRSLVRDSIRAYLPGSDATPQNSVLRVLSDAMGALCHLTLQYIDWLALQLLPDTAEHEWLDRHGQIWLVNSDNTVGRKQATLAVGTVDCTGTEGVVVPTASIINSSADTVSTGGLQYETTEDITIGLGPTPGAIRAITAGSIGNQDPGKVMAFAAAPFGVDNTVTVITLTGGADTETDDELRARVLKRIRQPPMGGDARDFEQWALAVPGVTRAWCAPLEMGIGTVTVRFMMDDLRAPDGFPLPEDVQAVYDYVDTVRPVAVKDFFVEAPLKYFVDFDIANLNPDNEEIKAAIQNSIIDMLFVYAAPGQTIFAAWKSMAIMSTPGVISFDLVNNDDDIMPNPGTMGTLGDIFYSIAREPPPAAAQAIAHSSHG